MNPIINEAFEVWLELLQLTGKEFANKRSQLEKLYKRMEHHKIQGEYHQLVHQSNLQWAADNGLLKGSAYFPQ